MIFDESVTYVLYISSTPVEELCYASNRHISPDCLLANEVAVAQEADHLYGL